MKLEPKSRRKHKRLIPYIRVPSPPHRNHGVEEMEAEDTPSMSPPPSMKLEPKSPHRHKRLIPYVSVPCRSSVRPANKRPANGDLAERSPKLSTKRRKFGSGQLVKDEVPRVESSTPRPRRTAIISAKRPPPQLPTPTTTSKRPKKEENKVFSLPRSITDTYLKSYEPLTITPPPTSLAVPRKLLRLAYGGSDQQFLQYIQPSTNPSNPGTVRRMVWPQIEMNPLMPSVAGHPGIVFASRHEILENPPWTAWCRCLESPKAMWCYLGEYESELCGQMSAEQFKDQPQKAKEAWAELLIKGKAFDVYVAMRARIALRKHNVFPLEPQALEDGKPETDEQVAERAKSLEDEEIKAIKRNKGRKVDSGDVIRAFSRGDEAIDIIRMRCVSYDHVFAQDLQRQFDNYDQLLEREKEKKAAEGKQGSSSKRKMQGVMRRGGKVKGKGKARDATRSDEESEDEEGEFEDDLQYESRASSSSSRPKRKSTKWDANTGGRVVVGRGDVEENDGNVEVLDLESDDDELPELTDSDSGADSD
ncbi:uncharacterized protein LACBIDRAFT_313095 [Laccaria bicolor S238N-H82]|uniref:Predicted protein n=1 Tax=Laccaria bicolor (strain S238N-H82 / ATCC MYA-4686) TaxID=486041 RepID=B0DXI7_LACBS|nr:uncharacterized protein LACBIDRAFT_313095 [Laccaria bicolor S238N-H82]EDR00627.1 predicted protein [Laccaria bicolor S238N-H82]|eukprot:XP_001888636.1 predicted protein [Laccaria bicolor S238N-H82]